MTKDAFYFKHDLHAREDRKWSKLIRELGYSAYGLGWAVIERIYEEGGKLPDDELQLAYELRLDPAKDSPDTLRAVLASDLFYRRDGLIRSESVDRRIAARQEVSRARAVAGSRGGKAKANADQLHSEEGKERKGEEREIKTAPSAVDLTKEPLEQMEKRRLDAAIADARLPFSFGERPDRFEKGFPIQELPAETAQAILDKSPRLGADLVKLLKHRIAQKRAEMTDGQRRRAS